MGAPLHYGLELPDRCMALIDALLTDAEKVGSSALGGLSTTFVLAMSTPMIVLPIERIWKPRDGNADYYVNERHLRPEVAEALDTGLRAAHIHRLPFFKPGAWRFASAAYDQTLDLTQAFSQNLEGQLAEEDSARAAAAMQPSMWAGCLRNALSHGGILYLDSEGRQAEGRAAEMFAFVSGKYDYVAKPPRLMELRALRIATADYVSFLRGWNSWLKSVGMSFSEAA